MFICSSNSSSVLNRSAGSARVFTSLLYKCLLTHTAHARSWCSSPVKGTLGRSVFKYLLTAFSGIFLLHLLVWIWSFTHFLAFFHTVQFINWRRHSRNCVWQLQLQKSGWTLNNNLKKLVNLRPLWKTPLTVWFVSPCIMSLTFPSPLSQLPLPPGVNTNVLWYPSKHSRFDHLSSSSAVVIINRYHLCCGFSIQQACHDEMKSPAALRSLPAPRARLPFTNPAWLSTNRLSLKALNTQLMIIIQCIFRAGRQREGFANRHQLRQMCQVLTIRKSLEATTLTNTHTAKSIYILVITIMLLISQPWRW